MFQEGDLNYGCARALEYRAWYPYKMRGAAGSGAI